MFLSVKTNVIYKRVAPTSMWHHPIKTATEIEAINQPEVIVFGAAINYLLI
jgi:hypothetical protein